MKKIIFLLFSLLLVSCNTTKRAEKRIYNIVENHQELIRKDTVKIDTVLTIPVVQDSVIFALDTIIENQTHTIRTERGEFGITILPSKTVTWAVLDARYLSFFRSITNYFWQHY